MSAPPSSSGPTGALRVDDIATKGRGYVAVRDIHPNEVLMISRPELSVLYTDHCQRLCHRCFSPATWTCGPCERFALCPSCTADPRVQAWHRDHECPSFVAVPPSLRSGDSDYLRLVIRFFAALQHGPPPPPPSPTDPSSPPIIDPRQVAQLPLTMCSNKDVQSPEYMEWVRDFARLFQKHVPFPPGFSLEDLVAFFCVLKSNSLGYPFDDRETVGWCLDSRVALFNHSCAPNCAIIPGPPGYMKVVAKYAIREGEEATLSYLDVDAFPDRAARRAHLFDTYRFHCRCPACAT
jgi:hypothetical protein